MFKKINKFAKKIKWYLDHFINTKSHLIAPLRVWYFRIFIFIFLSGLYLWILNHLGIVSFTTKKFPFIIFHEVCYKKICQDLVVAQIGSTFLTTAVLSLISSIEDKYIYGEKKTILLFGKYLQNFYIPVVSLYILLITNVVLLLQEEHFSLIVGLFILSLFILIHFTTKIGCIFISTSRYKNSLYSKYYIECEKNIKDLVPSRDFHSENLENLFQQTVKMIKENNIEYVKNIGLYMRLIDNLLFNIPKEFQKYHLHIYNAPSIIQDYLYLIEDFIISKNINRAIQYYRWLLVRLNFHNVFILGRITNDIFKELVNKITDLKNEFETIGYLNSLVQIITEIEIQQYFGVTNDFHYANLPDRKLESIVYYEFNYFELIYDKVYTNKYLSQKEKESCYIELYDIFRNSAYLGCDIIKDITNFSYEYKAPTPRNMPFYILGQASALLLLKTLQNKDERNFKLFLGMSIKSKEMRCAIHLMMLTLIKVEKYKDYMNIYCPFYQIDLKYCKTIINQYKHLLFNNMDIKNWYVYNLVNFLSEDYEDLSYTFVEHSEYRNYYVYDYFSFDESLLYQYFDFLSNEFNVELELTKEKE